MSRLGLTAVALMMVCNGLVVSVRAEGLTLQPTTPSTAESTGESARVSTSSFGKGTRTFNLELGSVFQRTGEPESLSTFKVGWGWYLIDRGMLGIDLVGYGAKDHGDFSPGIGANLMGRYHFFVKDKFSLYGDGGGGVLETADEFPSGGTKLNFTYMAGLGITYQLSDRMFLNTGVRFQHLSNGFIEGRDRNPIFNSYGGYLGLTFLLN